MANISEVIKTPAFLMKILELILEIIMIALMAGDMPAGNTNEKNAFGYGIMVGYIIISVIIIAGFILDHPLHTTLILMITGPGAILFITAGSLMIEIWDKGVPVLGALVVVPDRVIGAGILGLLTGAVYIVDTLLTYFRSA
eukprot:Gregarina_sp_Poly_1__7177@NODE_3938_length_816_cov_3_620828_g2549_i0_p1_GENE_NODE_3938_length_816_cov_3_620828_g2549_i0NODE_3938_length_816_cov_3_620828_g2549_i0_p1_ORF_typecomplete_len141_score11_02MARVEL/PF01284_23/6_3e05DUF3792/PF12670_7/0_0064DUF3792/PF12670_7/1_2e02ER_lumen_recept/PF00810_18/0_018_NODE_3938_length_816_cov_3_620828_g2549_i0362784